MKINVKVNAHRNHLKLHAKWSLATLTAQEFWRLLGKSHGRLKWYTSHGPISSMTSCRAVTHRRLHSLRIGTNTVDTTQTETTAVGWK